MRVILSTVLDASVTIESRTVGKIGRGYLLLVGGTQNVLKSKYNLKKYPIYLTFLKPLTPEDYKDMSPDEVRETVKSMIQEEVNAQRKAYFTEIEHLFKSKRGLKKFKEEKILEKLAD